MGDTPGRRIIRLAAPPADHGPAQGSRNGGTVLA